MKRRTLVMGDVHGAARAMHQVLHRCGFDPKQDKLVQLGDIADGWSEVSECVDILLDIKKNATEETEPIFIRGNHDVWVHDWMMYGIRNPMWEKQGGAATIDSYLRTGMLADRHHRNFWFKQHDWYIDDDLRLYIHGGWYYLDGFPEGARYPVNAGTISKECHWDRDLYKSARAAHNTRNTFHPLEEFEEVYIGHTALRSTKEKAAVPENLLNLWNMDTGCGWFGALTIMDVETKEFWQSDRVFDLYPDERGRG